MKSRHGAPSSVEREQIEGYYQYDLVRHSDADSRQIIDPSWDVKDNLVELAGQERHRRGVQTWGDPLSNDLLRRCEQNREPAGMLEERIVEMFGLEFVDDREKVGDRANPLVRAYT